MWLGIKRRPLNKHLIERQVASVHLTPSDDLDIRGFSFTTTQHSQFRQSEELRLRGWPMF